MKSQALAKVIFLRRHTIIAKPTVSRTALGAAICRLIEQYQPEKTRLFYDPLAKEMTGGMIRFLMQFTYMRDFTIRKMDNIVKGIYGAQICRTRYIDDAVQTGISQGIKQLVILGAGYDTRPYRLPGIEKIKVLEVDLPTVQNDKMKKLRNYLGSLPGHVSFIPIDFEIQTLEAALSGTNFNPEEPAIFVWEGVTQYISEESVRQTLALVGKSASRSIIIFTYVLKSIIERRSDIPHVEYLMDTAAKQSPWIFGLEPSTIPELLRPYHLIPIEDVANRDYQERYLQPLGRKLTVFEGERIINARVS